MGQGWWSGTKVGAGKYKYLTKTQSNKKKVLVIFVLLQKNNIREETKNYNSFDKQYTSYKRTSNAIFNIKKVDLDES